MASRKRRRAPAKAKPRAAKPRAAQPPIAVPPGWTLARGGKSISVHVKTKDFLQALVVMNEIGHVAEELEHHPDFHLERWNHLRIVTYSHDVGHLTDRDERLAQHIGELLAKRGLEPTPEP